MKYLAFTVIERAALKLLLCLDFRLEIQLRMILKVVKFLFYLYFVIYALVHVLVMFYPAIVGHLIFMNSGIESLTCSRLKLTI